MYTVHTRSVQAPLRSAGGPEYQTHPTLYPVAQPKVEVYAWLVEIHSLAWLGSEGHHLAGDCVDIRAVHGCIMFDSCIRRSVNWRPLSTLAVHFTDYTQSQSECAVTLPREPFHGNGRDILRKKCDV